MSAKQNCTSKSMPWKADGNLRSRARSVIWTVSKLKFMVNFLKQFLRPAYRRIQQADEVNVDFILWYFGKKHMWCVSSPAQIESEQAYMVNKSKVLNPVDIPNNQWVIFEADSEDRVAKNQVVSLRDAEQRI